MQNEDQTFIESVDSCIRADLEDNNNNLRRLFDDYRTLASVFNQVWQDFDFPNFAETQCQIQRISSYLEETVSYFTNTIVSMHNFIYCMHNLILIVFFL